MPIITITSDYGSADHYQAVIKGTLYSELDDVKLVDISSEVKKYDIAHAAYLVKNSYRYFPKKTIHLITVGIYHKSSDFLIVESNEQFFVGMDNGLFSLIFDNQSINSYRITIPTPIEKYSFIEQTILCQAAAHLARGGVPQVIAKPVNTIQTFINHTPIVRSDKITATIQYVDGYGNLITNIGKEQFTHIKQGRNFLIDFRVPSNTITSISDSYGDIEGGNTLAIFNSSGWLEIAIAQGNASSLLGLRQFDNIHITFK